MSLETGYEVWLAKVQSGRAVVRHVLELLPYALGRLGSAESLLQLDSAVRYLADVRQELTRDVVRVEVRDDVPSQPSHLCRAYIGASEATDLSRLLHRRSVPRDASEEEWALEIKGTEEPLAHQLVKTTWLHLTACADALGSPVDSIDPPLRIHVRYCPWCGDRLPRTVQP